MTMTKEHKAALAEGRKQGKVVRSYLRALEANKPRRGRQRTPESIRAQLEAVEAKLSNGAAADPMKRLDLVQRRIDLTNELTRFEGQDGVDISELEGQFIEAAKPYAERKGLTYSAFREVGVPPAVLKSAGVPR